ncbi:MAG TPA: HD domain-containing phosphohydrolase [Holophaga sp.]|nr:HD domain-containing phosphohydrolase [Holophaga sp.]
MPARVLFVDDDPLLLRALCRAFRGRFEVLTATSGHEALDLLLDSPPVSVIVADMGMPGMDGVELLQEVKSLSPDTVRIMLTGQGDQLTAIEAVNGGSVFRFLTKPCDMAALGAMVEAGIRQYDLVTSDRVLLEQTLSGSIQMLVDLLSVFDPRAFGKAEEVRDLALRVAGIMGIPSAWDLGLAALLAPVGRMAIPLPVQSKLNWGETLTPAEAELLRGVPANSARIVGVIPRLAPVARILRYAACDFAAGGPDAGEESGEDLPLESRILRAVTDFVEGMRTRKDAAAVLGRLRLAKCAYDPAVLSALDRAASERSASPGPDRVALPIRFLQPGMCLEEDLRTLEGALVLSAGTRLAQIHLERLRSLAAIARLPEPVQVSA